MKLMRISLCGSHHVKNRGSILGEIKLQSEHLSNSIANSEKEINKALLQGKVVLKKLHDWVEEAKAIEDEANRVVESAQKNSSFLEGGQLMNMHVKLIDVLKKYPFDHGLRAVNVSVMMHGSVKSRRKEPRRKAAPHGVSAAEESIDDESTKTGEKLRPAQKQGKFCTFLCPMNIFKSLLMK